LDGDLAHRHLIALLRREAVRIARPLHELLVARQLPFDARPHRELLRVSERGCREHRNAKQRETAQTHHCCASPPLAFGAPSSVAPGLPLLACCNPLSRASSDGGLPVRQNTSCSMTS